MVYATFSTNATTGNRSVTGLGISPTRLWFKLSQKTSTTESFIHTSDGYTDGTNQQCISIFWDASGGTTNRYADRVINHKTRVSGAITDSVVASLVSRDADGFTLNFSATVTGYRIDVWAE